MPSGTSVGAEKSEVMGRIVSVWRALLMPGAGPATTLSVTPMGRHRARMMRFVQNVSSAGRVETNPSKLRRQRQE